MTPRKPKREPRVKPVSIRPTPQELERWRACAAYFPQRSFSDFVRMMVNEGVALEEANRREDAKADRHARLLAELPPTEVRKLRNRGGDWASWPIPEADGPDDEDVTS
jgi:hypothetical protein